MPAIGATHFNLSVSLNATVSIHMIVYRKHTLTFVQVILHFLEIRLRCYYQLQIDRGLNPLKQNPGESVPNPGESVPNPGESVSGQKTEGWNHKKDYVLFWWGKRHLTQPMANLEKLSGITMFSRKK